MPHPLKWPWTCRLQCEMFALTHKRHPRGWAARRWRFEGMENPSAQSLTVGSRPKCGVDIPSYMTIELALLTASVILGILHIIIVSHLQSWQRGYWWTASSREQSVAPLTGIAGRAERALRNYLETFPFFAAAILVVTVTKTHSSLTVWGAHFYFWGRIVYAILYTADLPLARSLVWNIPTIGILMNVAGLFLK